VLDNALYPRVGWEAAALVVQAVIDAAEQLGHETGAAVVHPAVHLYTHDIEQTLPVSCPQTLNLYMYQEGCCKGAARLTLATAASVRWIETFWLIPSSSSSIRFPPNPNHRSLDGEATAVLAAGACPCDMIRRGRADTSAHTRSALPFQKDIEHLSSASSLIVSSHICVTFAPDDERRLRLLRVGGGWGHEEGKRRAVLLVTTLH
jgi:hypothetical protein